MKPSGMLHPALGDVLKQVAKAVIMPLNCAIAQLYLLPVKLSNTLSGELVLHIQNQKSTAMRRLLKAEALEACQRR